MKKLLLLLLLIPNLVIGKVCTIYITSDDVSADLVKQCDFEDGDIMKISAHGSEFYIQNEALIARDFFCDFSKTISVVKFDTKPPTLNISCVYKKN